MYDNRFNSLIIYFKTIKYYANIKNGDSSFGYFSKGGIYKLYKYFRYKKLIF